MTGDIYCQNRCNSQQYDIFTGVLQVILSYGVLKERNIKESIPNTILVRDEMAQYNTSVDPTRWEISCCWWESGLAPWCGCTNKCRAWYPAPWSFHAYDILACGTYKKYSAEQKYITALYLKISALPYYKLDTRTCEPYYKLDTCTCERAWKNCFSE